MLQPSLLIFHHTDKLSYKSKFKAKYFQSFQRTVCLRTQMAKIYNFVSNWLETDTPVQLKDNVGIQNNETIITLIQNHKKSINIFNIFVCWLRKEILAKRGQNTG